MSRSGRSSSSSTSSSGSNSSLSTSEDAASTAATASSKNQFKNDGSFLEMFKKMQEESKANKIPESKSSSVAAPKVIAPVSPTVNAEETKSKNIPVVGKRRGGRALPTGLVKKPKTGSGLDGSGDTPAPKDAWSQYMAEVRKYKESSCEEEGKTRPLVK